MLELKEIVLETQIDIHHDDDIKSFYRSNAFIG